MSNISTVYDAIISEMGTLFPNKTRVFDSINIADNPEYLLRNGWGFVIEGGSPAEAQFCSYMFDYRVEIVLTTEYPIIDDQISRFDTIHKQLLEDVVSLQKHFYNVNELGVEGSITSIQLSDVSGLEYIEREKDNFIYKAIGFNFKISEEL